MPTIKRDNNMRIDRVTRPAPSKQKMHKAIRNTTNNVSTPATNPNGSPRREQEVTVQPKVRKPATRERLRSAFNKTR